MKTITYSLRNNGKNSDGYYSEIKSVTDKVLDRAANYCLPEITSFMAFIKENNLEKLRTWQEYFFEFLMTGILWNEYSAAAARLNPVIQKILVFLVNQRQKNQRLKKIIDYIRGVLSTLFLFKNWDNKNLFAVPSGDNFSRTLKWLKASGEFREEVKRLEVWEKYFSACSESGAEQVISEAIRFSQWFSLFAELHLGKYTEGISRFMKNELAGHFWREDIIFCARRRSEYHLNMVGAEIMNRVFHEDFERTGERAVLMPACMRILPDGLCKAERNGQDYICTDCTPDCRVHQMNMMGRKDNFKVFIIPHSSDFSRWLIEHGVNSNVGTVGIACINNLISGGLELKSLDIPAQCVLLDYCGCKNHWDKTGFPTDINLHLFSKIMSKEKISINNKLNFTQTKSTGEDSYDTVRLS